MPDRLPRPSLAGSFNRFIVVHLGSIAFIALMGEALVAAIAAAVAFSTPVRARRSWA
jgi:hypothetical protein